MDTVVVLFQVLSPAAVIGAVALWRTHRVDRRNLLLKVHEKLIEQEQQVGRRLLHERADAGASWWASTSPDDLAERDKINTACAFLDVVGWYVDRGYVKGDDLLDLWASAVVRCWAHAYDPYIKMRREREGVARWKYFERLNGRAEVHLRSTDQGKALLGLQRRQS